jgi:glycogen debranching enzyme
VTESAWDPQDRISEVHPEAVVLIEGSSFCLCTPGGDITRQAVLGLFVRDTRVLSRWDLYVNDERPRTLAGLAPAPFRGLFLGTVPSTGGSGELVIERQRWIGAGLREQITVRNYGSESTECTVSVAFAADFAGLFEVKDGRIPQRSTHVSQSPADRCTIETHWRGLQRAVVIEAPGGEILDNRALFRGIVGPHSEWTVTLGVTVQLNGVELPRVALDRSTAESEPEQRLRQWRLDVPRARGKTALTQVLRRSQQDLGSLRIMDPEHPERVVVAAGAPWFMALFGRDSLLTSLMALPLDSQLALGTLQTLAHYQGTKINPITEEQPGRILHELRFGMDAALALGGQNAYYGTVDATPLFVVLLAELQQWGVPQHEIDGLLPHADRALAWIREYGDQDGDGFVEYERANDRGLINQGWKDSWDGVNHPDGSIAMAPIALCEVQGYVYSAYLARAAMAEYAGDVEGARHWTARGEILRQEFNDRFWLPERGYFAIALDRDKRAVESCASNMGHCLMSGIVDPDKAERVVDHLMSKNMFSGWGIRTLAADMGAYNPASYHNGSIWPHDNALIVAGLVRYGFMEQAQRVATALIDAAEHFDGRLPELFCGFDRGEYDQPIPYPTSCSPQAWAAAAPIHMLRSLLRFQPRLPDGEVWVAPELPASWNAIGIDNLRLGNVRVSLDAEGDRVDIRGPLPPELRIVRRPRDFRNV